MIDGYAVWSLRWRKPEEVYKYVLNIANFVQTARKICLETESLSVVLAKTITNVDEQNTNFNVQRRATQLNQETKELSYDSCLRELMLPTLT